VLALDPATVGILPTPKLPRVWLALMEMTFGEGSASLVALADGSTSLYTSTGGGVIGAGEHEVVAAATREYLEVLERLLEHLQPASSFELPAAGHVRFQVRTYDGDLTADALENDLGERRHPLSEAFFAAHEAIARMREIEEAGGGATA
jgi:hypothetical protein